jgi:hypothetical protein
MRRMYPGKDWLQYLFPIIIASSVPFTKYFVQTKQYTMDMLLAVLAIWQFLELFRQIHARRLALRRYFVLCVSLFVAPFFSYTYSIAIIPLFFYSAPGATSWHHARGFKQSTASNCNQRCCHRQRLSCRCASIAF